MSEPQHQTELCIGGLRMADSPVNPIKMALFQTPGSLQKPSPSPSKSPGQGQRLVTSPAAEDMDDLALARLLQEQERAYYVLAGFDEPEPAEGAQTPEYLEGDEDAILAWRLQQEEQAEVLREMYRAQGIDPDNLAAEQEGVDPDALSYNALTAVGELVGTVSKGLSQEAIDALPQCSHKEFHAQGKTCMDKCCICQLEYDLTGEEEEEEELVQLPCAHYYHKDCITQWLGINKVCPVCHYELPGK